MTVPEDFARRAARADDLAKGGGGAAPLLLFASSLLRLQESLAEELAGEQEARGLSGSLARDAVRLEPSRRRFLASLRASPAPELAEEAARRGGDTAEASQARLLAVWQGRAGGADDFLSRAFLRPYLETLRAEGVAPDRARTDGGCAFCGGAPSVGFLRPGAESEGAGRHLVCAFCGAEQRAARIRCPACDEQDPAKLPVFRSPKHPGARIDACETCRGYVKTVDLTVDARPLPEVDELLSVAMDLWAMDEGWRRIEPGLAGV